MHTPVATIPDPWRIGTLLPFRSGKRSTTRSSLPSSILNLDLDETTRIVPSRNVAAGMDRLVVLILLGILLSRFSLETGTGWP
jgi:hypothetical protein